MGLKQTTPKYRRQRARRARRPAALTCVSRVLLILSSALLLGPSATGAQVCSHVHPAGWRGGQRNARGTPTVRIVAVGDIMLGTDFPDSTTLDPRLQPGVDPATLIGEELLSVLRAGDVVFGNQEGALFDGEGESKQCRNRDACYAFRSPEWYAGLLEEMGFNLMSLANNHSGDFLEPGRAATMAALERHGIAFGGLTRPGAVTGTLELDDGTRVGLAAFSPNRGTASIHDIPGAGRLIRDLDRTHDVVIVSFHGGAEGAEHTHVTRRPEQFYGEQRGNVYEFAHAAVDAGADIVLGHGPHVPRAVELYQGRLIAYSLGNFWTWGRFNLRGPNGLAPVLDLEVDRTGRLIAARIHSARQRGLGSPRLDPNAEAARFIDELVASDFPEAGLVLGDDGRLTWNAGPAVPGHAAPRRP